MAYLCPNFQTKPNGDVALAKKYEIDVAIKTTTLSVINIPGNTIAYDSDELKVFRGGSQIIDNLKEHGISNQFRESFGKSHLKDFGEY